MFMLQTLDYWMPVRSINDILESKIFRNRDYTPTIQVNITGSLKRWLRNLSKNDIPISQILRISVFRKRAFTIIQLSITAVTPFNVRRLHPKRKSKESITHTEDKPLAHFSYKHMMAGHRPYYGHINPQAENINNKSQQTLDYCMQYYDDGKLFIVTVGKPNMIYISYLMKYISS